MENPSAPLLEYSKEKHQLQRRTFLQASSIMALMAMLEGEPLVEAQGRAVPRRSRHQLSEKVRQPFFNAEKLTADQVDALYGRGLAQRASNLNMGPANVNTENTRQHMIFYYDPEVKSLINPGNVKTSLTSAKYSCTLKILNTHVSQNDFSTLWKGLKNDAQLHLGLTAPSSATAAESDDLMWTLMNGIDIFLGGGLKGLDSRLKPFVDKNEPTSKFRPSEKVEIPSGTGYFQVQLAAQKKDSWWHKLLTIFGSVLDSPLFGTLPIPKLLPEAVQFTSAVLNHIHESSPVVPVWQSAGLPFKLYEGATPAADFKLRPGRWLTIDRTYAEAHLDPETRNLKDHIVDVLGQFNEVKTKTGLAVDANYAVFDIDFPAIPT